MKKYVVLIALMIVGILGFSSMAQADLNDGLVAYYPFNGNADDESGNGNDGTVSGATLTEDRFGNSESAYGFDGVDDYIRIDAQPSDWFYNNFSFSAWVNFNHFDNDFSFIFWGEHHNFALTGLGPIYAKYGKQNHISFLQQNGDAAYDTRIGRMDSDSPLNTNEWYYISIVKNNLNFTMYVNGELVAQTSSENNTVLDGTVMAIGANLTSTNIANSSIDGLVDDIRIYNRALSESEIQELYNETGEEVTVTDSDNDGVIDQWDECPDTPAGSFTNSEGCSAEQLGLVSDGFTQADVDQAVQAAIQACIENPASCGISIDGYTQTDLDGKYEAGKQYCINNPEECGISISGGYTQADIDIAVQACVADPASCGINIENDYQSGYDQGFIDGQATCEDDVICTQVITYGKLPYSDCWVEFQTPCDVPDSWETTNEEPFKMCGSTKPEFSGTLPDTIQSYLVLTDDSAPFYLSPGHYVQTYGSESNNTVNVEKSARAQFQNFIGANIINIEESSLNFTVYRSGVTVYLSSASGTFIEIAATQTPQTLRFADGSSELFINGDDVMLGDHIVSAFASPVNTPNDSNDNSLNLF